MSKKLFALVKMAGKHGGVFIHQNFMSCFFVTDGLMDDL